MRVIFIKKTHVLIFLLVIIGLIIFFLGYNKVQPTFNLSITDKVIVIDPGHGGVDPGALAKDGTEEEDINLSISLRLKKLLEQAGCKVIMTRDKDEGLYTEKSKSYNQKKNEDLRNRRIMTNDINPDLFITIHLNSFGQSKYYGAQTFYQKGSEEGKALAKIIQEELKKILDNNNKRMCQSTNSVYLLREVKATAILVECGFLSNPDELRLLKSDEYQQKIARGIYIAIVRYYN